MNLTPRKSFLLTNLTTGSPRASWITLLRGVACDPTTRTSFYARRLLHTLNAHMPTGPLPVVYAFHKYIRRYPMPRAAVDDNKQMNLRLRPGQKATLMRAAGVEAH